METHCHIDMIVYDKNNKEINLTENPNLLVNADFKSGIINQKGQSSYPTNLNSEGNKYTIDMWRKQYCLKVDVGSNFITVTNTQTEQVTFLQLVPNISGTFTFVCDVASLTGNPRLCVYDKGTESFKEQELKNGLNIFIFETTNVIGVGIRFFTNTDSVKVNFMKLEQGSYFTGMPVWNKAIEELKCSVFYRKITGNYFTASTTKILNIMCSFYPYMNKNPEIAKFSASHENGTIFNLTIKSKGLNHDGVWWLSFNEDLPKNTNIRWSIELDANDY